MITPQDLGFPETFERFRDCQHEAFDYTLTSEKRYVGLGLPPGAGKSGVAYGLAKLLGGRTIILTANHGLEDQYVQTFNDRDNGRIAHIRGRRNYPCVSGGNCDDGRRLGCADQYGCEYLNTLRSFNAADVCVTNYSWWLAVNSIGEGVAKPDTLICDEAGLADSWLAGSLNFRFTQKELRLLGFRNQLSEDLEDWLAIQQKVMAAAFTYYEQVRSAYGSNRFRSSEDAARVRQAEELYDKARKLTQIDRDKSNWIVSRIDGADEGRLWKFECIWPGMYRERLFQGIPRVILMSATLRPKTAQLLGIKRSDIDFKEWGRQFPAANGPVVWIPTVRMSHNMLAEDTKQWINRHDEIFTWGKDRNGLSHTVSYDRARQIKEALGDTHTLIFNGTADPDKPTARQAFDTFRNAAPGTVLVSPSFSTGWDFAGRIAEWQVISKIAFAPLNDRLIAARTDKDPEYPMYLAAQEFVQAAGRINRYEQDRGMTLCVDDHIGWLRRAANEHFPKWFNVRKEEVLPRPLEKI